jgi:predicted alpha/beta hydrolase family esterase
MSAFRIIFVHGYTASSNADWYPNISEELNKSGIDYSIPDLPGGELPHASEWLEKLHEIITKSDKPLVLVGHSLGTRAVLLYLEKYKIRVEKVFLISAFANKTENAHRNDGETYPDFFNHKIDLETIKSLVKKFIILHSKEDSDKPPISGIDYEQGVELAKDLNAELITFEGRKHFSNPDNAPYILEVLKKELDF